MKRVTSPRSSGCLQARAVALALTALAAVTAGCAAERPDPGAGRSEAASWHFDSRCTDPMCGFAAERGAVTREVMLPPAQYGLRIEDGGVAERTVALGSPSLHEGVAFVARCDPGARLRVAQTVFVWVEDGRAGYTPRDVVQSTQHEPDTEFDLYDVAFPARPAGQYTQRVRLSFGAVGGACVVGEVRFGTYPLNH